MKPVAIFICLLAVLLVVPQVLSDDEPLRTLGLAENVQIGAAVSAPLCVMTPRMPPYWRANSTWWQRKTL